MSAGVRSRPPPPPHLLWPGCSLNPIVHRGVVGALPSPGPWDVRPNSPGQRVSAALTPDLSGCRLPILLCGCWGHSRRHCHWVSRRPVRVSRTGLRVLHVALCACPLELPQFDEGVFCTLPESGKVLLSAAGTSTTLCVILLPRCPAPSPQHAACAAAPCSLTPASCSLALSSPPPFPIPNPSTARTQPFAHAAPQKNFRHLWRPKLMDFSWQGGAPPPSSARTRPGARW